MVRLLRLGRTDADVALSSEQKKSFFDLYHHPFGFAGEELRFRDDSRNTWRALETLPGTQVRELTGFLQRAGFMPNAIHDGIYGYVTQAAVRLFQEYVRTIDDPLRHATRMPASWPDGVVGKDTRYYIDEWKRLGKRCRWRDGTPSDDHRLWIGRLTKMVAHYQQSPSSLLLSIAGIDDTGDTLPPVHWHHDGTLPHLVGIRRNAQRRLGDSDRRPADDLFVLLISGRTFYFSGSTDARPSGRREAYLTEGQHRYRFNWHNIGQARRRHIYKAGRPAGAGVIVLRDVHGHNALTEANRRDGLDPTPNPTINIHWNGLGHGNWSAGCQVISGRSYLDDEGDFVNCTEYAARTAGERGSKRERQGPRLTMGAYTVLSDLLLCYTRPLEDRQKPTFRYSLFTEQEFVDIAEVDPIGIARKISLLNGGTHLT